MKILWLFTLLLVAFTCGEENVSKNEKTPLDDRIDYAAVSLTLYYHISCRDKMENETIFINEPENKVDKNKLFFRVYENGKRTEYIPFSKALQLVENGSNHITIFVPGYTANAWFDIGTGPRKIAQAHLNDTFAVMDPSDYIWNSANYYRSAAYTEQLGQHLAEALYDIHKSAVDAGTELPHFRLIGQSLGAHIAGQAGNRFKQLTDGKMIEEIYALDPARPCFTKANNVLRSICKEDTNQLTVIHTTSTYGIYDAIGHYDYYYTKKEEGGFKLFGITFGDDNNLHSYGIDLYAKMIGKTPDEIKAIFDE